MFPRLTCLRTLAAAMMLLIGFGASPVYAVGSPAGNSGQCLTQAATHYGVNLGILESVRAVEGGWPGARVKNRNGTRDLGVMQINSSWLSNPVLRARGITETRLANDTCVNYWVATWIYAHELRDTGGDPWAAAGNYHSHTPRHHQAYKSKVIRSWKRLGLSDPARQAALAGVLRTPSPTLVQARSSIALAGPELSVGGTLFQFPGGHLMSSRDRSITRRSQAHEDARAADNWEKFYGRRTEP